MLVSSYLFTRSCVVGSIGALTKTPPFSPPDPRISRSCLQGGVCTRLYLWWAALFVEHLAKKFIISVLLPIYLPIDLQYGHNTRKLATTQHLGYLV